MSPRRVVAPRRTCPPDHKHGATATCYTAHRCRCEECTNANSEAHYYRRHMRAAGRQHALQHTVDARGTRRRLQALVALGWSATRIATRLDVTHDQIFHWLAAERVTNTTEARVTALYERMSATAPPTATYGDRISRTRARNHAARQGWAPPLAWDDIDTDEHPADIIVIHPDTVDQVQVDLAVHGYETTLTPAERRLVVEQLLHNGHTDLELVARMAGCTSRQVLRIRNRITATG